MTMPTENFTPVRATGPDLTCAEGDLNAWSNWDDEDGVQIVFDTGARAYTVEEVQTFHNELGAMLDKIKETP